MTRVSSFGHQQVMLDSILRNQEKVFDAQKQISTGKKVDSYGDLTSEITTLLGSKNVLTRTLNFISASNHVDRNLRTNDLQISNIISQVEGVRDNVLNAISQEEATALIEILGETFGTIISGLNTSIGGVSIFGGARTDVSPVTADSVADLLAAGTAADLFQNDSRRARAKVGPTTEMEYGLLADEIGLEAFTAFKNIVDFDAGGGGPIDGPLTAAQRTFLQGELANLDNTIDNLRILAARNGTRQANMESTLEEHEVQRNFLEVFISDIEDVNMAEAITRVNNDQVALEASYKVMGQLGRLSLLNFI